MKEEITFWALTFIAFAIPIGILVGMCNFAYWVAEKLLGS